jgi:hypothetical protein
VVTAQQLAVFALLDRPICALVRTHGRGGPSFSNRTTI